MDRIVDHIFAFEGDGEVKDFWGSYTEYVAHRAQEIQTEKKQNRAAKIQMTEADTPAVSPEKKKLSYKERMELDKLGQEISVLEKRVDEINFIFQSETMDADKMKKLGREMDEIVTALGVKEARWLELAERD